MSARSKNSFELKGKTISAGGQTLAMADIAAVRRKSEYQPRRVGLILLLGGLALWGWGWRDETNQRQERQAKFTRDYAAAEQQLGPDGSTAAMDDIHPLDIHQALRIDDRMQYWGAGMLAVGFLYAFARRRRHHVIVTMGGRKSSIYWAKSKAKTNQIVEEIAAKMG